MTAAGQGRGMLPVIGAFIVLAALIIPTRPSVGSPPPEPGARPTLPPSPAPTTSTAPPTVRSLWPSSQPSSTPSPSPTATDGPDRPGSGCPFPATATVTQAPGTGRTVALTFDDGPSRYTPEVLDVLRREHVHATFFVVGANVAIAPDVVARTAREGHLVGDHTWHHAYPDAVRGGWTRPYLQREMLSTRHAITLATGEPVCWFRPPAGLLPPAVRRTAGDLGFSIALWSVDTRDWQLQSSTHEAGSPVTKVIVARAVVGLAQQHPVILMHDGGGHRQAGIDAVSQIIRTYRAHGYRFVRLDGRE